MAPASGEMTAQRSRWRVAGLVLAALLLVVLVVLGTMFYRAERAAADRAAAGEQAIAVARQAAIVLTSVSTETVDADVRRLADSSTGAFKQQFTQQTAAFRDVVNQAQVHSRGEITEAALERADERAAVVLVAVRASVSNAQSPEPQQRQYRLRITLERDADHWLVSNLEFVP